MAKPITGKGSELRGLIAWAKELGFVCNRTSKHIAFRRSNTQPVFGPSTPSCHRAWLNVRRDLRHALAESEQRKLQAQK